MPGSALTHPDGPAVISERTLTALAGTRKLSLLQQLYGHVVMGRANFLACRAALGVDETFEPIIDPQRGFTPAPGHDWLLIAEDHPDQPLPPRVDFPMSSTASEAATLRLALAIPASIVLIDGPIKDRAKLSFIKCEGTVSILVQAYREGHLSAVKPMVKALDALGFADVLPPADQLEALWEALSQME